MSRRFLPVYAPTLLGCVCTVNAPYYIDDVAKGETPKEDTESQHRTGRASVDNEEIEIKRRRAELMAFFDRCGRVTQSGGLFLAPLHLRVFFRSVSEKLQNRQLRRLVVCSQGRGIMGRFGVT